MSLPNSNSQSEQFWLIRDTIKNQAFSRWSIVANQVTNFVQPVWMCGHKTAVRYLTESCPWQIQAVHSHVRDKYNWFLRMSGDCLFPSSRSLTEFSRSRELICDKYLAAKNRDKLLNRHPVKLIDQINLSTAGRTYEALLMEVSIFVPRSSPPPLRLVIAFW